MAAIFYLDDKDQNLNNKGCKKNDLTLDIEHICFIDTKKKYQCNTCVMEPHLKLVSLQ